MAEGIKLSLSVYITITRVDNLTCNSEILMIVDLNSPIIYGQLSTIEPFGFCTRHKHFQTITRLPLI